MSSSWDALSLVRSRKFDTPTAKLVMILMAARVDERWSCFIGQERLADEVGCTDRTVREWQSSFEHAGLIERKKRYVGRGRTSDLIFLVRSAIEALPVINADLPEALSARSPIYRKSGTDLPETKNRSIGSPVPGNTYREGTVEVPSLSTTSRAPARAHDGTTTTSAPFLDFASAENDDGPSADGPETEPSEDRPVASLRHPIGKLLNILGSVDGSNEERESYTHRELLDATESLYRRLTQDQRDDLLYEGWGEMLPEEREVVRRVLAPPEVRLIDDLVDDLVEDHKESERLYPLDDWDLLMYSLTVAPSAKAIALFGRTFQEALRWIVSSPNARTNLMGAAPARNLHRSGAANPAPRPAHLRRTSARMSPGLSGGRSAATYGRPM